MFVIFPYLLPGTTAALHSLVMIDSPVVFAGAQHPPDLIIAALIRYTVVNNNNDLSRHGRAHTHTHTQTQEITWVGTLQSVL